MSQKKHKKKEERRREKEINIPIESEKENKSTENIIFMDAPEEENTQTIKEEVKKENIDVEKGEVPKKELLKLQKSLGGKQLFLERYIGLGKIFLTFFGLFVVYLIFGQVSDNFGPTTISLLSLWPLLLIFIGLSLFRVKNKIPNNILAIPFVFLIFLGSVVIVCENVEIVKINLADVVVIEERTMDSFNGIIFEGIGSIKIKEGSKNTITIRGDEAVVEEVETKVVDDTLHISYKNNLWNLFLFEDIGVDVEVTAKDISLIKIAGISDAEISNITGENLMISMSGKGSLDVNELDVNDFTVLLSGVGDITVSGKTLRELVVISGIGSYFGENVTSLETGVRISGVGNAKVNTKDELDVSISGKGDVVYTGSPNVTLGKISGSGSVVTEEDLGKIIDATEDENDFDLEDTSAVDDGDDSELVADPKEFLKSLDSVFE